MNLKGWIDELMERLCDEEDIEALLYRDKCKGCYMPWGAYSEGEQGKELAIYANPPSLARLGLAHLIAHELAHVRHKRLYGDYGDDYSPEFKELEAEMIERIWEICLEEHEG